MRLERATAGRKSEGWLEIGGESVCWCRGGSRSTSMHACEPRDGHQDPCAFFSGTVSGGGARLARVGPSGNVTICRETK